MKSLIAEGFSEVVACYVHHAVCLYVHIVCKHYMLLVTAPACVRTVFNEGSICVGGQMNARYDECGSRGDHVQLSNFER